ncbi:acetyl/propionyl/methylcrotonyl-CoA carboxylase subunit alpha [Arsenicitalea aurantiaca]|uniref:propionyl-CoA carboxylase n=1 Tax=Arsenicitalea aurantiaca TaxID=1783274 RepID=A0A433X430_9HYPH|nr:acetyl/propionyl/methylcrotonyl-CoA carboxylase subunit alpha [Arsenicitalea aurantiaca]RUT28823.1 acetyl/propionyl/methylcrotonyl-CoA carboxylase subunit alpha [Arsenicitalea aurantiaca]
MIKSLLIANRGEIACRIMATARRMGLRTIAVYSDADRESLHVAMADEAVRIGPAPARESYLSIPALLEACRQTGAEAVHPGYGFLSENPEFPEALAEAGIVFVGPPPGAIAAMGDKITSKEIAARAGVPTVPGHMDLVADGAQAEAIAAEIGYPVMIKASAGGGGKGMRIARNAAEAREGFERARSEARPAFGDERIFIEKYIERPRHIEIQVLADAHGNVIHLGERECSIQRRNQKVIEEAPSPFVDAALRTDMGARAVALARAVGYQSAGTVEFIVDASGNFFFLEMNTRLQVEHPVTELVTGLDLVELMIRIACGEKLPIGQDDVVLNGWALEARVYAEDPYRDNLPSTGRLVRYRPPAQVAQIKRLVRNDTGVFEGAEISPHYDPMIAKLCGWARNREEAIETLAGALDQFEIEGVGNNLPLLSSILEDGGFKQGEISTAFLAERYPDGFTGPEPDPDRMRPLLALAAFAVLKNEQRGDAPSAGRRAVILGEERFDLSCEPIEGGMLIDDGTGEPLSVLSGFRPGDRLISAEIGGAMVTARIERRTGGVRLRHRGYDLEIGVYPPHIADLLPLMPKRAAPDLSRFLLCPMPGQLMRLSVATGDLVEPGEPLAIVEAMKMENVLLAERRARIGAVHASAGDVLAVDAVILEFEAVS